LEDLTNPFGDSTDGEEVSKAEVGTKEWVAFKPWQNGKASFFSCEVKNGNGEGFWPDEIKGVWSLGMKWDNMKLKFEVGRYIS